MTEWVIIVAMLMGSVVSMVSVALGGILVFRTKREAHEPLFQLKAPEGDIFSVDDIGENIPKGRNPRGSILNHGEEEYPDAEEIMRNNARFMSQFMGGAPKGGD